MFADNLIYYSHFKIFNFLIENPNLWNFTKILFIITSISSTFIIFYFIYSLFKSQKNIITNLNNAPKFGLLIGIDNNKKKIYIPEKGLYQNFLITGTIGSGKTSSALYPFTKQLINQTYFNNKLSFLILDVKGNYYSKVLEFARESNRLKDVIVIELGGRYTYNLLISPNLRLAYLLIGLKRY